MNEYYILREDMFGNTLTSTFRGTEEDAICRAYEISRETDCFVEVYDIATDTVIW